MVQQPVQDGRGHHLVGEDRSVPSGGTASVAVTVVPIQPGTETVAASVSAPQADPNMANNSAAQATTVNAVAGTRYVSVTDKGFAGPTTTVTKPLVQFNLFGTQLHRITDNAALLDTGDMVPVAYFRYNVPSAGTFLLTDSATGLSQPTTKLPVKATLKSNGDGTFTIAWGFAPMPAGSVWDVKVKRPGTTKYQALLLETADGGTLYTPTGGPGTYSVIVRTYNPGTGSTSGFSPAVSFKV